MKSPNNKTEFNEEGAAGFLDIQENFKKINILKNQSSDEFFGNISMENDFKNIENYKNYEMEFLGDSEDSTEISFILSNLNSTNNFSNLNNIYSYDKANQKAESEYDSENTEILNILNRPKTTNDSNAISEFIPKILTKVNQNHTKNSLEPIKPIPIKKISLAGKVLKGIGTADKSESLRHEQKRRNENLLDFRPERSSNPMTKNYDFEINDFHFFQKFQLNKL